MINQAEFCENLKTILLARIDEGKLVLPVLPDVVTRVERTVQDPNFDVKTVTTILDRDPVLAAQVIQTSNSAAFSRGQRNESLRKAVTLLGARNLKSLLLTTVSRQVFTSRVPRVQETLRAMWDHSLAVAVFSQDVAGLVESGEPEAAYLAGLLHDVGQAIVGIYLLEVERSILERRGIDRQEWINHDIWLEVVRDVHRPISSALAEKWNLPSAVCEAIAATDDFDMSNRRCIANVVRFCDALAVQAGIAVGEHDLGQVGTLLMIGRSILGLDEEVVERLTTLGKGIIAESRAAQT
jgi:HD-like signal output (HDOD) protein